MFESLRGGVVLSEDLGKRPRKRFRSIAVAIGVMSLVFSLVSPVSPVYAANITDGFQPGNIISDGNFYDGNAMTASQVQTFLNQQVPRCTIGDSGRAPGSAWGNTTIAKQCVQNLRMTTKSKSANEFCSAYVGATNETGAQIIAKVGKACGISQKALLVMLQKEQSLVADTWPTVMQMDWAMGYACPDTAPCDSEYRGFFNQVYKAAWQLKVYKAYPNSYRYKAGQVNTIQWHPNSGCGTSQVRIENAATAGLYIYTPYRPNQAALNAGWGTGDGCSTYGNRNFYNYYKAWFGLPVNDEHIAIDKKYSQNSWLGPASTGYNYVSNKGGGVVRAYQSGAIASQDNSNSAVIISGDFRTYFGQQGGIAGPLGWPLKDEKSWNRGRTQSFQGGAVSWTPEYGFADVRGMVRTHYADWALAYDGPLGWPIGNQRCSGNSCIQQFEYGQIRTNGSEIAIRIPAIEAVAIAERQNLGDVKRPPKALIEHGGGFVQSHASGAIAWSNKNGAFSISGSIREAYGRAGGVAGPLGWPTSTAECSKSGRCSQDYLGGTVEISSDGRSSVISPEIRRSYIRLENAGIDLGGSLGDTKIVAGSGGRLVHAFEYGAIAYAEPYGGYAVSVPIRAPYNAIGGLTGSLGWPVGDMNSLSAHGGGVVQAFENGAMTSSQLGSFVIYSGPIRADFGSRGGIAGPLGWPISEQRGYASNGGGAVQRFQGGALFITSSGNKPVLVKDNILGEFDRIGQVESRLGWPLADQRQFDGNGVGTVQGFQHGAIVNSAAGTFVVEGQIRSYYGKQGGVTGYLGWPVSNATLNGGEERQAFQGGIIVRTVSTGAIRVE